MTTHPLTINAPDGLPVLEFSREFDAPVAAVFEAHRDPDLYRQWLGPHGYEMEIERHDFTTGGGYAFVHRSPEGGTYRFRGTFHTIRPDFVVQTFEFEGAPDQVSLESMSLVDLGDGRTRLDGRSVYLSQEARDTMVASGWDSGVTDSYERLDALLAR